MFINISGTYQPKRKRARSVSTLSRVLSFSTLHLSNSVFSWLTVALLCSVPIDLFFVCSAIVTVYLQRLQRPEKTVTHFTRKWAEERVCCVSAVYPLWRANHCWVIENASLTVHRLWFFPGILPQTPSFVLLQMQGLSSLGHRLNHHCVASFGDR